ncbi:MAG: alpha/beta fold hydrolase [Leifsonia sp.]|nr:alpha/beta fold hydrolase [Leifsonia sp.]
MAHHLVQLRNGRHVGVTGLGDPMGKRLVIMCHPSPGAGGFDPDPPATSTAGIRMIGLDRAGYGASDPAPDSADPLRTWLDDLDEYLRNVENIAKSVAGTDFGAVGVLGWGVGAVYATGLAARHPDLVNRVALIEPTGATPARLQAAESGEPLDARLEDAAALGRYPGASDRLREMLTSAGDDPAGAHLDARVMRQPRWPDGLAKVRARTVILSSDQSDGVWYRRQIHRARSFESWDDPATTIVAGWKNVLRFFTSER